jgi:hypothetical protein
MTDAQPPPQLEPDGQRSLRTSALAIAALVLSVIPCCPMVNLAGAMIGVAALRRIDSAPAQLGGRRLAIVAIAAGLGLSIFLGGAWIAFAVQYQDRVDRDMVTTVETFVRSAADGDVAQARAMWSRVPSAAIDDAAVFAFGQEVKDRYGALERISIASTTSVGSVLSMRIDAACVFSFESSTRTGSAGFQVISSASGFWPTVRLVSLRIDDADRGNIIVGPKAETP